MINLFDKNFRDIRDKHINPLISYNTDISKYDFWGFKDNLVEKSSHIIKNNGKNNITFIISDDIILNTTLYEIELWLNKIIIQFCNYEKLHLKGTWSIVSLYYLNFYLLNLISVITGDGYFYLDEKTCKKIVDYYSILNSTIIKLEPGNYHFKIQRIKDGENNTNEFDVTIKKSDGATHSTAWMLFDVHLNNFIKNSSGDEKVILQKLKDINNFYKPGFQSELRNDFNYPSKSSMHDFSGKMNIPDLGIYKGDDEKFFRDLVHFTPANTYQSKIQGITFYSIYFFNFSFLLYHEYLARSKPGKDFHKFRQNFLLRNGVTLPEF